MELPCESTRGLYHTHPVKPQIPWAVGWYHWRDVPRNVNLRGIHQNMGIAATQFFEWTASKVHFWNVGWNQPLLDIICECKQHYGLLVSTWVSLKCNPFKIGLSDQTRRFSNGWIIKLYTSSILVLGTPIRWLCNPPFLGENPYFLWLCDVEPPSRRWDFFWIPVKLNVIPGHEPSMLGNWTNNSEVFHWM